MSPDELERRVVAEARARDLVVRLRRLPQGTAITVAVPLEHSLAWSLDGRVVAMAEHEALTLVPALEGPPIRLVIQPAAEVRPTVHWLADGGLWLDCGADRVLAWRPGDTALVAGPALGGRLAAVRPDGQRAVAWQDHLLFGFTASNAGWRSENLGVWGHAGPAAFGPDGLYLAVDGELVVWDADTFQDRPSLRWPQAGEARRPRPQHADHLAVGPDRIAVLAGPWLYTWTLPGWVEEVRALPALAGPVISAATTRAGVWRVDATDGLASDEIGPLRGVRAVSADASGAQVAILRGNGLWVRAAGQEVRRADVAHHTVEAVALPDRHGDTWILGLEGDPGLPVLAAVENAPLAERPAFFSALIRGGAHFSAAETGATVEAIARINGPAFELGRPVEGPIRQHLLIPALQLGAESYGTSPNSFALHLGLTLAWRTQQVARWGERTYVAGLPLTVTIEPGVRLVDATALELGASVMTEAWGGVFGRVGYALESGDPYALAGVELGEGPVRVAAGLAAVAALIYAIAQADLPAICHRCSGPNASE